VPHVIPGAKVQVFHGFNVEKRDGDRGHFRIRGLFDLYCTQGPATTKPFQALAAQHGHFAVVETGWPKLDPLFSAENADRDKRCKQRKPVVLYAATFTERLTSAPHLYDTIAALVRRGDRHWLLSLHPKCPADLIARYRALACEHARFVEPEELVMAERAADVLICDTSSVIPECVVQGEPVVTFRNRSPRPWMLDIAQPEELDAAIERAIHADADWRRALALEAARIHPWRDGRSSERVIAATEALLDGRLGPLAPKPRNAWRKLQIRWDLGWFGPAG
jgi:CDP-glycerol glycerophosphotransferase (TagB/SpsB family)